MLYEAAIEVSSRSRALTASQTITTVAGQSAYRLNADFLDVFPADRENRKYVSFFKAGSASPDYLFVKDYTSLLFANNASASDPGGFAITDATILDQKSGSATADGVAANGESILTDSSADFSTVAAGDIVHNATTGDSGYVTVVSSGTSLTTCLFDESSTAGGWSSGDDYFITPQGRFSLVLDAPSGATGDSVVVTYIKRPAPVFSPYRGYSFPAAHKMALVYYAAHLYRNRGREPGYADDFLKRFEMEIRKFARETKRATGQQGFRVNFIRRGRQDGSNR